MEFIVRWKTANEKDHPYYYWTGNNGMKFAYVKEGVMKTESRQLTEGYPDLKFYPAFTQEGINHRVEGNILKREVPDMTRYVTINSLDELLQLQRDIDLPVSISHTEPYTLSEAVYFTGNPLEAQPLKSTRIPEKWYMVIDDSKVSYPTLD